jgi:Xaa-Pro dipeptidase
VAVAVAAAIQDRGLESAHIGLELAAVPAARFLRLRELLPSVEWVDAAPLLFAVRARKSATEIERLRRVAHATDVAIQTGYDALSAQCSELEFERVMAAALVEQGVAYGWCSIAYGPKGATDVQPSSRLPTPGEIIRVDLVGFLDGYFSDISRVAAFARTPDAEAQRAHTAIYETNALLRSETGPGVRASDLNRLAQDALRNRGYRLLAPYAGHGIGRDVHEPPFLADWDEHVLAPGMVLDLEPTMRVSGVGSVNIEDMVLVTDNGCEALTTFPRELLIFGHGPT